MFVKLFFCFKLAKRYRDLASALEAQVATNHAQHASAWRSRDTQKAEWKAAVKDAILAAKGSGDEDMEVLGVRLEDAAAASANGPSSVAAKRLAVQAWRCRMSQRQGVDTA